MMLSEVEGWGWGWVAGVAVCKEDDRDEGGVVGVVVVCSYDVEWDGGFSWGGVEGMVLCKEDGRR